VADKYFTKVGNRKWIFCANDGKKTYYLYQLEKPLLFDIARSRKGGTLFYQNLKNTSDVDLETFPKLMFGALKPRRLERKPTFYAKCVVGP